jgi:CBS domain-containing protein
MTSSVITIKPSKTAYDAARMMRIVKKSGLVVVDDSDNPIGMITEKDLSRRVVAEKLDPSAVKIADIMSKPLITIEQRFFIEDAARLMAQKDIKRLPVVADGKLVGIITSADLTRYIDELDKLCSSI